MQRYIMLSLLVILGFGLWHVGAQTLPPPQPIPLPGALNVDKTYVPSGFMGDGKAGKKYVQINEAYKDDSKAHPTCIKVSYIAGPEQWAGMYWLNKADNWGDKPGDDFSAKSFTKITFYARGEKGGEVIEFKAGGVDATAEGKKYKDSLEVSTGKLTLDKAWKQYTIPLDKRNDLSSVIGIFCWTSNTSANPDGFVFYLDAIQYEGDSKPLTP